MRVRIIQPLIPHYRLTLFRKLSQIPDLQLVVSASRSLPWVRNLQSVDAGEHWQDLNHQAVRINGTPFVWQKNMELPSSFTKGDVLVLCGELRYLSNYFLLLEAKRRGVGLVWWTHAFGFNGRITHSARISMARLCDVTLLYLNAEKQAYISHGLRPQNVFAAQNAIDQSPIKEARKAWSTERLVQFLQEQELGGCKMLLYCGRLGDADRLALGIQALAELIRDDTSYRFVFIGEGECRDSLLNLSDQLGVRDHVRFLGAIYDQNLLAPWFLTAQSFVFPRSLGLSVFHAFGYGLPVITHNNLCRHTPEIHALQDGYNGLLFKDGDASDLAAKIRLVTNDRQLRETLSGSALRTVQEEYNMDIMARNFRDALEKAHCLSLRHK